MTEYTCESAITGKTVRIRHATPGDTVFIEERLRRYGLDASEIDYAQFVVAAEDEDIIAVGRLKPADGADTITVLNERREKDISELVVKHLLSERW